MTINITHSSPHLNPLPPLTPALPLLPILLDLKISTRTKDIGTVTIFFLFAVTMGFQITVECRTTWIKKRGPNPYIFPFPFPMVASQSGGWAPGGVIEAYAYAVDGWFEDTNN